jgi:branched-chain amino acid transport system permease protein
MDCSLDIFFVEALLNGVLLAGLLALLALGLNLIFGVIDVTWICYAELVMVGMYGFFWLTKAMGGPNLPVWMFVLAGLFAILVVALAGALLHVLVIRPVLDQAPINQLLVTGGVLFVLQASATLAFGIDFKNIGVHMGSLRTGDMSFSWSKILTFGVSLVAMLVMWLFLTRTYIGTAIRAIAQDRQIMPLMGVDARKVYVVTSGIGGALAGLGNMLGGFVAAFVMAQFIAVGSSCLQTEWGYAVAFLFFMVVIFIRPQGLFGVRS